MKVEGSDLHHEKGKSFEGTCAGLLAVLYSALLARGSSDEDSHLPHGKEYF